MAVVLYSHDAEWAEMRVHAAASVSSNYMKTGTAVGSDAAEAGTTSTVLNATAHAAQAGDWIVMTSGGEDGEAREVASVTTNAITLDSALSGAPSATETFNIIRPQREHSEVGSKILLMKSTLDADILISFDGSTDHWILEAGDDLVLDFKGSNLHLPRGDDPSDNASDGWIYIKEASSTPTSGSLYIGTVK